MHRRSRQLRRQGAGCDGILPRLLRLRPQRSSRSEDGDEFAAPHSITSSARSHSGRPPNMNTTPAQLETPRPTPPRYLV